MNLIKHSLPIVTSKENRTIRVLLPDDFDPENKTYQLLMMHDGQNLFEDETAYGGHSWGIYETLKALQKNDIIVVGIDNSELRFFEYAPWESSEETTKLVGFKTGGLGDVYASFIHDQVLPFIISSYPIDQNKPIMIGGSSMGAYISVYIALKYPLVFKIVGVFSLASWFNEEPFITYVEESNIKEDTRFFISIGKHESSSSLKKDFNEIYLNNSRNLKTLLEKKQVQDIFYIETEDQHNELAWRKVFKDFILWATS